MKNPMKVFLGLALSFILSCNSHEEAGQEALIEVNNDFVAQPLGFQINESNIIGKYPKEFSVKSKPINNKHDNNVIVTLKTFENSGKLNDSFLIYKTHEKEFLKEAKIRTNRIELKDNIKVGMSKESFTKKLNLGDWSNVIKICNTEQTINWIFYFSDSKLDSIFYQGYVD